MANVSVKEFTYKTYPESGTGDIVAEIYADGVFVRSRTYVRINFTVEEVIKQLNFEGKEFGFFDIKNKTQYKLSSPPPQPQPIQPPEKVEQERLQTASNDQVVLNQQDAETIDANQIEKATPADLKAMGIAKLPLLLLVIGNQVKKIITPALKKLIDTYIKKFLDANACPDAATSSC
jgi:hypothetical protein